MLQQHPSPVLTPEGPLDLLGHMAQVAEQLAQQPGPVAESSLVLSPIKTLSYLIPGLGRSPGEGKGYPLQYSGRENSMDCIVHGVSKTQTQLNDFHFHLSEKKPGTELHI